MAGSASRAMFGKLPVIGVSQFTSFAIVPLVRCRRSSFANVRIRVWISASGSR